VSYQLCVEPRRGRLDRPLSNPERAAQRPLRTGKGIERIRRCPAGVNGGNAVLTGTVIGRAGHRTDMETSARRRLPLRINARVCRCAVRCNAGTRTGGAVHPYRPPPRTGKRGRNGPSLTRARNASGHQHDTSGPAGVLPAGPVVSSVGQVQRRPGR